MLPLLYGCTAMVPLLYEAFAYAPDATAAAVPLRRAACNVRRLGLPRLVDEEDFDLAAARSRLERLVALDAPPANLVDGNAKADDVPSPVGGGAFRFESEAQAGAAPPIDDIAAALDEVSDLGERVGGLLFLGLTFWTRLPGIQAMLIGSFLLFFALLGSGLGFGSRALPFVAQAPSAAEGSYYRTAAAGVTNEAAYVLD